MKKRLIDILISVVAIFIFFPFFIFIAVIVAMDSRGPIIFYSERVGIKKNFAMPKFRTMHKDSPIVATHLLNNSDLLLTRSGKVLRILSLDELPQLFSVLKGDMSLVGPRPALFNQYDLINLRKKFGILELKPGITGWAQINGRDSLTILEKVKFDKEYLEKKSMFFDIKILLITILIVVKKEILNINDHHKRSQLFGMLGKYFDDFGAIMQGFICLQSHAPHQLKELFAMM